MSSILENNAKEETGSQNIVEHSGISRRQLLFVTAGSEVLWSYFRLHIYCDFRGLFHCKSVHNVHSQSERSCCTETRIFKSTCLTLAKLAQAAVSGKVIKTKELSKQFERNGWSLLAGNVFW